MTWWLGLAGAVVIALMCWAWWHAGVEWMRDSLMRDYHDEQIGP